jgi:hypothetical protein
MNAHEKRWRAEDRAEEAHTAALEAKKAARVAEAREEVRYAILELRSARYLEWLRGETEGPRQTRHALEDLRGRLRDLEAAKLLPADP